jgi:predicted DNA-binding transcriptional regulator YafY
MQPPRACSCDRQRLLTIAQTCKDFGFSRSSFYRMAEQLERDGVVVRVPPVTGDLRVIRDALIPWLVRKNRRRSTFG